MSTHDPPRILSVEDNPDTRLLLRHALQDSYEVVLVPDVETALDAMGAEDYDLLLIDINLGTRQERGGVDLLHMIREREDLGPVPAVAVTAFSMPGDREDLLSEGFDGYVGKPFSLADLQAAVDRALSSA